MDSRDRPSVSRRRLLAAVVAASGTAIAGCAGQDVDGGGSGGSPERTAAESPERTSRTAAQASPTRPGATRGSTATTGSPSETTVADRTPDTTPETGELDLREANVTAVSFGESDGGYRFSVTLYHDDDGEDGYANWWQVETASGERLGRRKLLHAHGTRRFTRSERVSIPGAVRRVVVRGHDQTHGYGGQAAVVDLATETVELVRQGSEPDSVAERE